MQIIPVIDLKNGIVVHAKQGNRDSYAPLKSNICIAADIFDVVESFSTLFNSSVIYIADLNAITEKGDNATMLLDVLAAFPNIMFWIDGGYPLRNDDFFSKGNFFSGLGNRIFPGRKYC